MLSIKLDLIYIHLQETDFFLPFPPKKYRLEKYQPIFQQIRTKRRTSSLKKNI